MMQQQGVGMQGMGMGDMSAMAGMGMQGMGVQPQMGGFPGQRLANQLFLIENSLDRR